MKSTLMTLVFASLISFSTQAHDGPHGPGQIQPTKGGVIMMAADKFYLEVVGNKNELKFYPLQKESAKSELLKAIPTSQVKLSGSYTLPRGKAQALTLKQQADHFSAAIDAKSSHRYQVDVSVDAMGVSDKLTYQIEPQE